jgi:hypothetical protein
LVSLVAENWNPLLTRLHGLQALSDLAADTFR